MDMLKEKREEVKSVVKIYIKRLEALKERAKTYRFISASHEIWKDVGVTLKLLK